MRQRKEKGKVRFRSAVVFGGVSGWLGPMALLGKMFYTVEEAATRLGMKVSWLYERTRRKAIPHRRLGKYVRFTEGDLRAISDAAATGTLQ